MISPNPLGYFVVSISLILKIYFPHPWRSQCLSEHFFVISQRVEVEVTQLCLTLCDPMDCPWNSPGQNTGVGSLFLLQGIFPTQGSNPGLSHCRQIFYQLSHQGRPTVGHSFMLNIENALIVFNIFFYLLKVHFGCIFCMQ